MKYIKSLLLLSMMFSNLNAGGHDAGPGTITRVSLASSETGNARNIDIWLADGYDSTRKYAVIYMHDGQMLFDSTYEPNQEKINELMEKGGYRPGIEWKTEKFEGADHSERSWSLRLDVPLIFLLRNLPV